MPEFSFIEIAILGAMLVLGIVLGWILRGSRCAKEKIAVNAGWQEQLEAQRGEHDRLAKQNKNLMEQIGQYQASMKDSNLRAKELSASLKETFERRDKLQRQLKDLRGDLEVAIAQRDKYKAAAETREARDEASAQAIRERDDKINRLRRELTSWQARVPPLVDRFRERDLEAQQLQDELEKTRERIAGLVEELEKARERIATLESAAVVPDQTRIEPADSSTLGDGLNASNDPMGELASEFDDPDLPLADSFENDLLSADEPAESADSSADTGYRVGWREVEAAANVDNGPIGQPEVDDLKLIKGVGPAIEKTLNDLGIYRFNQIAEMSEYDIDRVAQRLKGFRSRIYREDWVGQARHLLYQKNNDRL